MAWEYGEPFIPLAGPLMDSAADERRIWVDGAGMSRRPYRQRSIANDRAVAADSSSLGAPPASPAQVGLVLYVSSASSHSQRAVEVLKAVLENCEPGMVSLTVLDLSHEPHAGADDRIAYTPTLVKVFPEPRAWVVGNLDNPQVVLDMLGEYLINSDGRGSGHELFNARKNGE